MNTAIRRTASAGFARVYRKVLQWFGGRDVLASATAILATVVVIGIPLLGFLGLVAAQAVQISKELVPWVQEQLPATGTESQDLLHDSLVR